MSLYPWLTAYWQQLSAYLPICRSGSGGGRSFLLTGPVGFGKKILALHFAKTLLCDAQGTEPCLKCRSCHWLDVHTHPDFYAIAPEEGQAAIKIEAVRGLTEALLQKPQHGALQVAVIEPADALTLGAANALLKTMEEPLGNVMIVLVTAKPNLLPITIRSRCQRLHASLQAAAFEPAVAWLMSQATLEPQQARVLLQASQQAPFYAKNLQHLDYFSQRSTLWAQFLDLLRGRFSVCQWSETWTKNNQVLFYLQLFYGCLRDALCLSLQSGSTHLINVDFIKELESVLPLLSCKQLLAWAKQVQQIYNQCNQNTHHFNQRLLIESVVP